jgi:UTP--glucose-1-phosphate uridylyltransferase
MTVDRALTKAVIPAAGLGTRFLPATKATPKEMLPVVDKPAIQYVVEEAAAAGLTDLLVVTGRTKRAIEDHFDEAVELELTLAERGDAETLALVRAPTELARIHYVRQGDALGLGHAVGCAEQHVGDEPFAVLLGDDLVADGGELLRRLKAVRAAYGGSVVALMRVPEDEIHRYGCAAVELTGEPDVVRVVDLVEKPAPGTAPSNLAVIGRYVLDAAIFGVLAKGVADERGEIQLTDALRVLAHEGLPGKGRERRGAGVHGVIYEGRRFDTGNKLSYLEAVVELAVERDDLGPPFRAWLQEFCARSLPPSAQPTDEHTDPQGETA